MRIEFPGAFYHIFSRGNGKQKIFLDEEDYRYYLDLLQETVARYQWVCHAYCLEVTHYHLLLETPQGNLTKGMHCLNSNYSQAFNRRHGAVGHVMQGRYKSPLIQEDRRFLAASRYIVLNPVHDGLVVDPADWKWSNYAATIGDVAPPGFLETLHTLRFFDDDMVRARDAYRQFVADGIDLPPDPDYLAGIVLEDHAFEDRVRSRLSTVRGEREFLRRDRFADRSTLVELFRGARHGRPRNERIILAYLEHGYSRAEIAWFLRISVSTVGRVIRDAGC